MPSVRVCIWNIQDYGSEKRDHWGPNSRLRNSFIRDFAIEKRIDVLLIMEVRPAARPSLDDLRTQLNQRADSPDWCSSFCGSSIATSSQQNINPPQSNEVMSFKTGERREGYGVLWRSGQWGGGHGRFRVLRGLYNIGEHTGWDATNPNPPPDGWSPLNMVTRGRPAGKPKAKVFVHTAKRQRVEERKSRRALGGFTTDGVFPFEGNVRLDYWPELEFPATGKGDPFGYRQVRRPTYVTLELATNGGPAERLCPVAAYHAPSKKARAGDGTNISGLSRELYVTNTAADGKPEPDTFVAQDKVVFGGDFNTPVEPLEWPGDYRYYWRYYDSTWPGGAECAATPPHDVADQAARKTHVRLAEGTNGIYGDNVNDYLHLPIDLVFTRPEDVKGERVNLLRDLLTNAAPYSTTLEALSARIMEVAREAMLTPTRRFVGMAGPERRIWKPKLKDYVWRPIYHGTGGGEGTWIKDWDAFTEELERRQITSARHAAELYAIFISDHLPLVADIPI